MNDIAIFDGQKVPIIVSSHKDHGIRAAHSHTYYEFVYIEQGFALHMYNNETTLLTAGDLFVIRPGDVHGYTSTNNTHLYNCLFLSDALQNVWDEIMDLHGIHQVFDSKEPSVWKRNHLDVPGRSEVVEFLERMIWERENKSLGWELKLKSLLTGFLILFFRGYNNCSGLKDDGECGYFKHVHDALRFIENNFKEDISVKDIASTIGLSVDYFSRQFKQFIGITPIEYIKSFRFAKAIEIMKDPSIPLSDIAWEVGFNDPCYFTRQFKRLFGMSPSRYRSIEIKNLITEKCI